MATSTHYFPQQLNICAMSLLRWLMFGALKSSSRRKQSDFIETMAYQHWPGSQYCAKRSLYSPSRRSLIPLLLTHT